MKYFFVVSIVYLFNANICQYLMFKKHFIYFILPLHYVPSDITCFFLIGSIASYWLSCPFDLIKMEIKTDKIKSILRVLCPRSKLNTLKSIPSCITYYQSFLFFFRDWIHLPEMTLYISLAIVLIQMSITGESCTCVPEHHQRSYCNADYGNVFIKRLTQNFVY